MAVGVTLSIGCIVYQTPPDGLPLSAEVCLNETYTYLNETTTAAASTATAATATATLLWNSSVTPMTVATSSASDRFVQFQLLNSTKLFASNDPF